MTITRREQRRKLAKEPISFSTLFRYVYLHSPLTDPDRSALVRLMYFLKYCLIVFLIGVCIKFVYGSWIEYYEDEPSSSLSFKDNFEVPLPGVTVCSRPDQNKNRRKVKM